MSIAKAFNFVTTLDFFRINNVLNLLYNTIKISLNEKTIKIRLI